MLDLLMALHRDPEQQDADERLESGSEGSENNDDEEHLNMTQVIVEHVKQFPSLFYCILNGDQIAFEPHFMLPCSLDVGVGCKPGSRRL